MPNETPMRVGIPGVVSVGDGLQTDNGNDERNGEKYPPEISRILKNKDSHQHGAYGSDARPDRIGHADREVLGSFYQQQHTQR